MHPWNALLNGIFISDKIIAENISPISAAGIARVNTLEDIPRHEYTGVPLYDEKKKREEI